MKVIGVCALIAAVQSVSIRDFTLATAKPEEISQETIGRISPDMLSAALEDTFGEKAKAEAEKKLAQKRAEEKKKEAAEKQVADAKKEAAIHFTENDLAADE